MARRSWSAWTVSEPALSVKEVEGLNMCLQETETRLKVSTRKARDLSLRPPETTRGARRMS